MHPSFVPVLKPKEMNFITLNLAVAWKKLKQTMTFHLKGRGCQGAILKCDYRTGHGPEESVTTALPYLYTTFRYKGRTED